MKETIDISEMPDVVRLVEEATVADTPLLLRRGDEVVAIVHPLAPGSTSATRRQLSSRQIVALRSAAGGWKEFDAGAFIHAVYRDRDSDDRRIVDL